MANLKRMMFTDEDSQQKVSLADLLDSYADKQADKQQKKFEESLDAKLAPVMQKVEGVEKRMDTHEARMDERMGKMESRIDELQESATSKEGPSGYANALVGNKFVPTFFDIKNFCLYSEKKTKGISRDQAEELVKKLTRKLPDSMKAKVGDLELFGTKVHKFRVHVAPPGAIEIALIFKEELEANESLRFNDRKQYTVAERTDEEEKRYRAAGKAMAYIETKAKSIDNTVLCKCSWYPDWNLKVVGESSEVIVGTVRADASIGWSGEGLRMAANTNEESVSRELAAFRQA